MMVLVLVRETETSRHGCVGWCRNGGGSLWQLGFVFAVATMVLGCKSSFLVAYVSQRHACCVALVF